MKSAFVCWTPYQLMNTLNFVAHDVNESKKNADIFLIGYDSVVGYINGIKDCGLFSNVTLINPYCYENSLIGHVKKTVDIIFPKRSIKNKIYNFDMHYLMTYNYIYASGWDKFFVNLSNINPKAQIILLEDGMASYLGDFREREMSALYKLVNRLSKKGPLSIDVNQIYLYDLKLAVENNMYPVSKLPSIDEKSLELIKRVFEFSPNDIYKQNKVIYLDQSLDDFWAETLISEKQIFEILSKYKDKVLVRKHPTQNRRSIDLQTDEAACLWEILCGEYISDDSVLISVFSTAQFTPYILYKKRPKLILLYKLLFKDNTKLYGEIFQFVEKYKAAAASIVYEPKTLQEFDDILHSIKT